MSKLNKFNISAVVYSMVYQKVYSFMFLHFNMGERPSNEMLEWAVAKMVEGSPQTEIIEMLLHEEEVGGLIRQAAVKGAIRTGNLPVLKAVLRRSKEIEIPSGINEKPEIKEYL